MNEITGAEAVEAALWGIDAIEKHKSELDRYMLAPVGSPPDIAPLMEGAPEHAAMGLIAVGAAFLRAVPAELRPQLLATMRCTMMQLGNAMMEEES